MTDRIAEVLRLRRELTPVKVIARELGLANSTVLAAIKEHINPIEAAAIELKVRRNRPHKPPNTHDGINDTAGPWLRRAW